MVPGRKFCTSTSACATSLARTSRPISLLISIDSERLPRFEEMHSAENSPALSMVARLRREMIILFDQQDRDSRHLHILQHFFERLDDDGCKPLAGFIQDHQIGSGH